MRRPRMQGRPPHTVTSVVIRSILLDISSFRQQHAGWPRLPPAARCARSGSAPCAPGGGNRSTPLVYDGVLSCRTTSAGTRSTRARRSGLHRRPHRQPRVVRKRLAVKRAAGAGRWSRSRVSRRWSTLPKAISTARRRSSMRRRSVRISALSAEWSALTVAIAVRRSSMRVLKPANCAESSPPRETFAATMVPMMAFGVGTHGLCAVFPTITSFGAAAKCNHVRRVAPSAPERADVHRYLDGEWSCETVTAGALDPWPRSGSSEVEVGRLGKRDFVATIASLSGPAAEPPEYRGPWPAPSRLGSEAARWSPSASSARR